jgi:hypothetical protein
MVKDAVYTFKLLKHYKPFDSTFFRLAKLGIFSAKQFYTTILYTDKQSYKFLKDGGLEFDQVIFLDSIEEYKGGNYAMPKILTMIERTSPYIHLDFDSILIEKPKSNSTVSFPFPEPDLTNITTHNPYEFVYIAYVKCFIEEVLDKVDYEKQKRLKWDIFPNNSALIVNNPKLISDIYKEIIEDFSLELIEKINPTAVEQQYLLSYLEYYELEYSFRKPSDTFNIIDYRELSDKKKFYYLDKQKYVHMSHYSWWPEISNEVLDFFYKKLNYKEKKVNI